MLSNRTCYFAPAAMDECFVSMVSPVITKILKVHVPPTLLVFSLNINLD